MNMNDMYNQVGVVNAVVDVVGLEIIAVGRNALVVEVVVCIHCQEHFAG